MSVWGPRPLPLIVVCSGLWQDAEKGRVAGKFGFYFDPQFLKLLIRQRHWLYTVLLWPRAFHYLMWTFCQVQLLKSIMFRRFVVFLSPWRFMKVAQVHPPKKLTQFRAISFVPNSTLQFAFFQCVSALLPVTVVTLSLSKCFLLEPVLSQRNAVCQSYIKNPVWAEKDQVCLWFSWGCFIAEGYSLAFACRPCCWNGHTINYQFMVLVKNLMITDATFLEINRNFFILHPKAAHDIILEVSEFKPSSLMPCGHLKTLYEAVLFFLSHLRGIIGVIKRQGCSTAVCGPPQKKEHFRWP